MSVPASSMKTPWSQPWIKLEAICASLGTAPPSRVKKTPVPASLGSELGNPRTSLMVLPTTWQLAASPDNSIARHPSVSSSELRKSNIRLPDIVLTAPLALIPLTDDLNPEPLVLPNKLRTTLFATRAFPGAITAIPVREAPTSAVL